MNLPCITVAAGWIWRTGVGAVSMAAVALVCGVRGSSLAVFGLVGAAVGLAWHAHLHKKHLQAALLAVAMVLLGAMVIALSAPGWVEQGGEVYVKGETVMGAAVWLFAWFVAVATLASAAICAGAQGISGKLVVTLVIAMVLVVAPVVVLAADSASTVKESRDHLK